MDGEVTVREIMTREYVGVSESDPVGGAVELMLEEGATGVVVLRGNDPVGMFTAGDALALLSNGTEPGAIPVEEVMSGTAPSVDVDARFAEVAGTMADAGVGHLLVTDGGELVGVVTEHDVVRAAASFAGRTGFATDFGPESAVAAEGETAEAREGGYSRQSVCEICGSLTPDLQNFNGQLICEDCRDV